VKTLKLALRGVLHKLAQVTGGEKRALDHQRHWRAVLEQAGKDERNKKLSKAERGKASARADHAQARLIKAHKAVDRYALGIKRLAKREAELKKKIAFQKKQEATAGDGNGRSTPDKLWNPYHRPIATWMIEWNDKTWAAGCHFAVTSGVRTSAESVGLCRARCGRDSCPGTCAGVASNHNCDDCHYPHGAEDVTNYYQFKAVQYRIGSPLRNDLPIDPVHFSVTGH
jgi:hypothetical protein